MIETAAVIRSELQVEVYRLLSDFFRFCGVSVYDYAVTERTDLGRRYEFDAVFIDETDPHCLSESQRQSLLQDKCVGKHIHVTNEDIGRSGSGKEENKRRKDFLAAIIGKLKELNDQELMKSEDQAVLEYLADQFVDLEIMKNRIILQTFLNMRGFVRAVRQNFVDAYIALLDYKNGEGLEKNSYFWFAQRYLERNINESCGFLDEDMLLATEKVVSEIEAHIKPTDGPQYRARLYSTIAHLYECDFFRQKKSTEAYRMEDQLYSGSAFESYSAYRLGRSIEKQFSDWDSAIGCYSRSMECAPDEYRAVYKIAVYQWKQKNDVESACKSFRDIDRILQNRYNRNVIQPREAEYLYKAWHFIRQIIREKGDRPVDGITASCAEKRMQDILQKIRDVNHENQMYTLIFGPDAQIDSADPSWPKVDARTALAERVKTVCTL